MESEVDIVIHDTPQPLRILDKWLCLEFGIFRKILKAYLHSSDIFSNLNTKCGSILSTPTDS